jgi:hypothetical protein
MQVVPPARAPKFSKNFEKITEVDVTWRANHDTSKFNAHINPGAQVPFLFAGSNFEAAMSAGISVARGTNDDQAQALLQAKDGNYYLAPLNTVVWVKENGKIIYGYEVSLRIDGRVDYPFSGNKAEISAAFGRKLHPDLVGIVGAYSWIDFRSNAEGKRTRLPKLS